MLLKKTAIFFIIIVMSFKLSINYINENAVSLTIDIVIKSKEIPIVFLDIPPNVVSKVSRNYEKAAFLY